MKSLLLILAAQVFAMDLPVEFQLTPEETMRALNTLKQTYTKFRPLGLKGTRNGARSIETDERWIGDTYAAVAVDSCSHEDGYSISFSFPASDRFLGRYPMKVILLVYDPRSGKAYVSMFSMNTALGERTYEHDQRAVLKSFWHWMEVIEKFFLPKEYIAATSCDIFVVDIYPLGGILQP